MVIVGELYGAESKSQVHGTLYTFLHENQQATDKLGIDCLWHIFPSDLLMSLITLAHALVQV